MHRNATAIPLIRPCISVELPSLHAIERLYAAASQPPPLSEKAEVAALFARLYGYNSARADVAAVTAHLDGELVGFAYGHPWEWDKETDPWSQQLQACLGEEAAALIEGSFSVLLLAVHPSSGQRGVGTELLEMLMAHSGARTHWLQTTDADSPAQRLYRRQGYRKLGHGPEAPDGRPGLVLVHTIA
ncbi:MULTISPECIES: GNAT family N-acetyltransferase [Arthrobacter]|uniref:GNAT family N-acetyltransferase n=1 Tax=Arthrobacter TaxID=1663 RepID=UPI000536366D|nr:MULTISPECIES: GNAT family N-acetyltransferase [Arthrobacter]AIY03747.1 hypothetical protein ART_4148 [Arthrobacter sp. PAMC 25486]